MSRQIPIWFAVTSNEVWNLGDHNSKQEAFQYAYTQFRVPLAAGDLLIVNQYELDHLKNKLEKRLKVLDIV